SQASTVQGFPSSVHGVSAGWPVHTLLGLVVVVTGVVVVVVVPGARYVTSSAGQSVESGLSPVANEIRSPTPFPLSCTENSNRTCVRPVGLIAASPAALSVPVDHAPLVVGLLIEPAPGAAPAALQPPA